MKISIITTLYYSAPYIQEFYERSLAAALKITSDVEFVIVNDGSPDNVLEIVRGLCERDERIVVVDLSRNFGHHRAIMTGLSYTTGDLVFLIDCDLEEVPEILPDYYTMLVNDPQADVVYGIQPERQGPLLRRWPGDMYYRLVNALSDYSVPRNILMSRLITQRYVRDLLKHQEKLYSIEGLWQMTGYKQIPILNHKTYKGSSTYTWRKKISLAISSLTAMSSKPLMAIAVLGLLMVIPSGLMILILIEQRLTGYTDIEGWTSLLVSLWFLSGLIIFILGLIAIYLSVLFTEIKTRPYSIVRDVYRHNTSATPRPTLRPIGTEKELSYSEFSHTKGS